MSVQGYTLLYDAIVSAMIEVQPSMEFIGLVNESTNKTRKKYTNQQIKQTNKQPNKQTNKQNQQNKQNK
jgi:hypothetical protein